MTWNKQIQILSAGFILLVFSWIAALAQTATPEPNMPPLPQGLDPPPTVYPPTQVSQGSQVYYLVCMACHGDRGQGLTDEWRESLDPPDQNCWQSRCHASNYPPGGFVFPKIVPALASPGMLARFESALDLYLYLEQSMPFQAPGSLEEEEYWQLTAFLLSLNGIDPSVKQLGPEQAARIPLRGRTPTNQTRQSPYNPEIWIGLGLFGLAILAIAGIAGLRWFARR